MPKGYWLATYNKIENKDNLGYQDLDIEVDRWSIRIEQKVESEKITFSGDGNDFRKWLEKNW